MYEFFYNIWSWATNHWGGIVAFLTSSTFAGLVTNIILIKRQGKDVKENTSATNKLNENTVAMVETKASVDDMKLSNEKLQSEVTLLKTELENERNIVNDISYKLSTVLDVMQVVYSTIKDETIRKTVNGMLIDAKYAETSTKAELTQQVEELKSKLAERAEELKDLATTKLEEVKFTAVKKSKHSKETTRY